jgi:hypothetical protein
MKVKFLTACVALTFLAASSAFAFMGPPTAGLNQGQWSAGANYSYSSQDLDTIKITWDEVGEDDGTPYTDSGTYKLDIRNLNTNSYFGKLGYGLMQQWEVYGQIGLVDIKAEAKEKDEGEDWYGYNLDNELAWGLGTKYTFYKQNKIDWGATVQLNWFDSSESESYTWSHAIFEGSEGTCNHTGKGTTDIQTLGIIVAVGPNIDMGGWKLYGGALYQLLTSDYDYKEHETWEDTEGSSGWWTCTDSGDTDTSNFGGYVGAQMDVYKNYSLAVEVQGTNNGWGAAVGVEIPF